MSWGITTRLKLIFVKRDVTLWYQHFTFYVIEIPSESIYTQRVGQPSAAAQHTLDGHKFANHKLIYAEVWVYFYCSRNSLICLCVKLSTLYIQTTNYCLYQRGGLKVHCVTLLKRLAAKVATCNSTQRNAFHNQSFYFFSWINIFLNA